MKTRRQLFCRLGLVAIIFFIFWHQISAYASEGSFSGRVLRVKDGDSIIVMHGSAEEEIRLNAVDCPEKNQPFGDKSSEMTSSLCLDKEISIKTFGSDRYGRTIGDVSLPDGKSLNSELVRTGCAWWYQRYAPKNVVLKDFEEQARQHHMGLWEATEPPIAPWDWRHGARKSFETDGPYQRRPAHIRPPILIPANSATR